MFINVTVPRSNQTNTAMVAAFNPDTGNHEVTTPVDEVYVEVQLSEGQVAAADAYDEFLKSGYYQPTDTMKWFGIFLQENYAE